MTAPSGRSVFLIVRPDDRATTTRTALADLPGDLVFTTPLSYVRVSSPPFDLDRAQAVLVSSWRAPHFAGDLPPALLSLPTYVVGEAGAAALRDMGFSKIGAVAPTGAALVDCLRDQLDPASGDLLYLRGDRVAVDFAQALSGYSYTVKSYITYQTVEAEGLAEPVAQALASGDVRAVLFFSRETAARFSTLFERAGLTNQARTITALCLSKAVLESASSLPWARTYVAEHPDLPAMAALARTLFPKD